MSGRPGSTFPAIFSTHFYWPVRAARPTIRVKSMQRLGQYELLEKLGEGAHGVVHRAYDTKLLRHVVVKSLHPRRAADRDRSQLLREARVASAIDHPNVCAVYDIHESDEQTFIVLQYVPGQTLAQILSAGSTSVALAISVARQVADGLAEAHVHGIVHRDLKPANIMVTEAGVAKILDFGLARWQNNAASADEGIRVPSGSGTSPAGTIGYMAPEQFVGEPASTHSDVFSLGVVLFQMLTGQHPFVSAFNTPAAEVARAIQFHSLSELDAQLSRFPKELTGVLRMCLAKVPSDRFSSGAELRDSLDLVHETLGSQWVPSVPQPAPDGSRRGLFSMLNAFVTGARSEPSGATLAVLPFEATQEHSAAKGYGLALSSAVATRLARLPGVTVRAARSVLAYEKLPLDPAAAGRALHVDYVVGGTYTFDGQRFIASWQLVDVKRDHLVVGGSNRIDSVDSVAAQSELAHAIYSALHGATQFTLGSIASSHVEPFVPRGAQPEGYQEARVVLTRFVLHTRRQKDLDYAREKLELVVTEEPDYAPAHAALGIAHLQYAQNGFGDPQSLRLASSAFERALSLDANLLEARIFRVYTLMSLGEKESARHAVLHLLETAGGDFSVRLVASSLLRLDGAYEAALDQLTAAISIDPAQAHVVYNHRARIQNYLGDLTAARRSIDQALELEPLHPLLCTTHAYLLIREGRASDAVSVLVGVIDAHPTLLLAHPTLALAHLHCAEPERARTLITDRTRLAASSDSETAYRLATFHAAAGEKNAALHWLRRAIYLGNENAPWFAANPMWERIAEDVDFLAVVEQAHERYRRNLMMWRRWLR